MKIWNDAYDSNFIYFTRRLSEKENKDSGPCILNVVHAILI